jgi:hypothetical protein
MVQLRRHEAPAPPALVICNHRTRQAVTPSEFLRRSNGFIFFLKMRQVRREVSAYRNRTRGGDCTPGFDVGFPGRRYIAQAGGDEAIDHGVAKFGLGGCTGSHVGNS